MANGDDDNRDEVSLRGKGQAGRLGRQHELGGGPIGIFGHEAQLHDMACGDVAVRVVEYLSKKNPKLHFRYRNSVPKREINDKLASIDKRLGKVLFVKNASVKPDGGVIEVEDKAGKWRIVLIGESKHQGNDIEKIKGGIKQGKEKDADFMVAGNAIERVHKNILEFRNFMLDEKHFPYVVFLQGSNFATESFSITAKDGREIKITHDAGNLNRIDRVTASSYAMDINKNYVRNVFVKIGGLDSMLQVPSLYFQCDSWSADAMFNVMLDAANTSLDVLRDSL